MFMNLVVDNWWQRYSFYGKCQKDNVQKRQKNGGKQLVDRVLLASVFFYSFLFLRLQQFAVESHFSTLDIVYFFCRQDLLEFPYIFQIQLVGRNP